MTRTIKHPLAEREVRFPADEMIREFDIEEDMIDVAMMIGSGCDGSGKMPTSDFEPTTMFVFDEDDELLGIKPIDDFVASKMRR